MVGDLRWRSCITGFKCGKGEGERDVSFDCVPTAKPISRRRSLLYCVEIFNFPMPNYYLLPLFLILCLMMKVSGFDIDNFWAIFLS